MGGGLVSQGRLSYGRRVPTAGPGTGSEATETTVVSFLDPDILFLDEIKLRGCCNNMAEEAVEQTLVKCELSTDI